MCHHWECTVHQFISHCLIPLYYKSHAKIRILYEHVDEHKELWSSFATKKCLLAKYVNNVKLPTLFLKWATKKTCRFRDIYANFWHITHKFIVKYRTHLLK